MKRLILPALIISIFASPVWAHAEIFSDCSLEQAKQDAIRNHKLLVVDFTASWCPPCRRMETATWADEAVQRWIKENAIAVQLDVDRQADIAAAFHVEAMPTIVLLKPEDTEKEASRQVGYMAAEEMLSWLSGVSSGQAVAQDKGSSPVDQNLLWEHISKARQLLMGHDYESATAEYVWLWNNLPAGHATFGELRSKAEPVEMRRLCKEYPAAASKFSQLREAALTAGKREDWLILNDVLEQSDLSLQWFDEAKKDPAKSAEIQKCASLLEPVLFNRGRWADAATYLYPDPIARVNEFYRQAEKMKHPGPDTQVAAGLDPMPSMVLLVYGAYVGAGRDGEAKKIYDECVRLDDTEAMRQALANMARSMQEARSRSSVVH